MLTGSGYFESFQRDFWIGLLLPMRRAATHRVRVCDGSSPIAPLCRISANNSDVRPPIPTWTVLRFQACGRERHETRWPSPPHSPGDSMKSIEARAVNSLVAACAALNAIGCSGNGLSFNFSDAAAEDSSGNSSGSSGSPGSSGGSRSIGSSGSSSGSVGSSASSGSGGSGSSSGGAGSSSSSGAGGDGGICTTNTDCGAGKLCGFPELAGCSATGRCFPASGAICNGIAFACACDDTDVNIACDGLPSGYAPKPVAHSEACGFDSGGGTSSPDGGSDGSSGRDAGTLACGPYSCDVATEFCFEAGGGDLRPDGGSNLTYACNPIPARCQPAPTCACLVAADAGIHGCPCSVQPGGALLATCLDPRGG
jgi:hypothetical protein